MMDLLIWKSVFHSYLLISYSEILIHVSQFQMVKFMFVVFSHLVKVNIIIINL